MAHQHTKEFRNEAVRLALRAGYRASRWINRHILRLIRPEPKKGNNPIKSIPD